MLQYVLSFRIQAQLFLSRIIDCNPFEKTLESFLLSVIKYILKNKRSLKFAEGLCTKLLFTVAGKSIHLTFCYLFSFYN